MKKLAVLPPKNNGGTFSGGITIAVDWDHVLNGSAWLATHGTDFTCTVRTFASRIYQAAKRKNKRVSVRIINNTVAFQAHIPTTR